MPDSVATDPLEAGLRRIAEALVAEAPNAPGLPDGGIVDGAMIGPGPSRRRRPSTAVAAAAVVVVILVAGALAVTRGNDGGDPDEAVLATDAGLEPAPQRLILDDGRRELPLDDGDPVPLELAGLDPHGAPRPLPDGGHVVVGIRPVEEPPPEGFNEFTDLAYGLAVVGADGEVDVDRDIEASTLVGVTATEAILARQPTDDSGEPSGTASIVTHDLVTGEERVVHQDVTFNPNRRASARSAVVAGDLVTVEASQLAEPTGEEASVLVPGSEECTLRLTDLATGDETERPLALACSMVRGLQASPDGSRAAVAYESSLSSRTRDNLPEVRLAVVDLPDGAVSHDQLLGHNIDCRAGGCPPDARPLDYQGMAWNDAATLRVAMLDLTASFGDLTVQTFPVD
jgi:hypothetical protein